MRVLSNNQAANFAYVHRTYTHKHLTIYILHAYSWQRWRVGKKKGYTEWLIKPELINHLNVEQGRSNFEVFKQIEFVCVIHIHGCSFCSVQVDIQTGSYGIDDSEFNNLLLLSTRLLFASVPRRLCFVLISTY